MRFLARINTVRISFVLALVVPFALLPGCGKATSSSGSERDALVSTSERAGTGGIAASSSTSGTGGMSGAVAGLGGTSSFAGERELIAILDDTTPFDLSDVGGWNQKDELAVVDPAHSEAPLLTVAEFKGIGSFGATRVIGTSKSKKRLGVVDEFGDLNTLRVFDENVQQLAHVALVNEGVAVYPTESAIFAITSKETITSGFLHKLDSQGALVGSVNGILYGIDLVVDEDREIVWTAGMRLTRTSTDLTNEQEIYKFPGLAVSIDLDAQGGVWVAERRDPQAPASLNQLVHFDAKGNRIDSDTLALPGMPMSVRFAPNSGFVWVAMRDAGVAYRDENAQLVTVPGLSGTWFSIEPDPLDGTRAWAASSTSGKVVHVGTNGFVIQSLEGFSTSCKWLGVLLQTR